METVDFPLLKDILNTKVVSYISWISLHNHQNQDKSTTQNNFKIACMLDLYSFGAPNQIHKI